MGKKFKPYKDVVQLQYENIYPKGQAEPTKMGEKFKPHKDVVQLQ